MSKKKGVKLDGDPLQQEMKQAKECAVTKRKPNGHPSCRGWLGQTSIPGPWLACAVPQLCHRACQVFNKIDYGGSKLHPELVLFRNIDIGRNPTFYIIL